MNLDEYLKGASRLPYQYRALMAWVLHGAIQIPYLEALSRGLPPPLRGTRLFVVFICSWLSVFGAVVITWRSLTKLTGNEEYSRWASLLVLYMAYFQFPLVFGLNFLLPYDLPSLFFFSGCIYCVICGRMPLFYAFFALGTLNRETICMATLFYAVWVLKIDPKRPRLLLFLHVFVQAVIWVGIKIYLHSRFGANIPDTAQASFYYKLGYNLRVIIKPQQWPILLSSFGFTLPIVLVFRKSMRNAAMEAEVYLVAVWFGIMMLVGVITEIRVFSELIAYLALALGLISYHHICDLRGDDARA